MVSSVAGDLPVQIKNNQSVNTAAGNGGQKMSQYSWFTVYSTRKKHPKDYSLRCSSHSLSKLSCTFKTTYKESIHPSSYSRSGYALDLLVTVSSMRYRTSTSALSTSSSSRGLTNLTLWDISS